MTFGEKVKENRIRLGLTQQALADKLKVTRRTVISWEKGEKLPKTGQIYRSLAELYELPVDYLLSEEERFIIDAGDEFGYRGRKNASSLMQEVTGLFAGGELPEEDLDEFMLAIQTAYVNAKRNNKKFTPKKYRKDLSDND